MYIGYDVYIVHIIKLTGRSGRCELYVADSYNHKIKRVTGPKNDTVTLLGDGPGDGVGNTMVYIVHFATHPPFEIHLFP